MSRRILNSEEGSLPLTLLATIVVAGLISVLLTRSVAGERAVRFDRNFGESLQVADVGVSRGLFALNEGFEATLPTPASPASATVDGIDYEWWAEKTGVQREWQITSQATSNDVSRRVLARIEERPLFFPGAFGDKLIALNGTSTDIDSYNSDPSCTTATRECRWGSTTSNNYQQPFGTGNGSIGTNEDFDFDGNTTVRPGGAFLYDWRNNPGTGVTASDPFGDRCDGNPCTTTYTSTRPEKLDFVDTMGFITSKFESGGGCDSPATGQHKGVWPVGAHNTTLTLTSYLTSQDSTYTGPADPESAPEPTDDDYTNYYCAHSVEVLGDLRLDPKVTPDNPVVIFVKDYVTISKSGAKIACHNSASTTWCDKNDPRKVRPQASRLQIYVAGIPHTGSTAGDVAIKSQSMFAGVIYAPLSRCGGSGGGGADVYGAIMCGTMDNVGNWDFHYDDALGVAGSGQFNVAHWQEVAPE